MDNFIIYVIAIVALLNLLAFIMIGLDKSRSMERAERVPEVYFFFLASCFGSLGVMLGMLTFRHKTKKIYFPLGIGIILIQQVLLIAYIINIIN